MSKLPDLTVPIYHFYLGNLKPELELDDRYDTDHGFTKGKFKKKNSE